MLKKKGGVKYFVHLRVPLHQSTSLPDALIYDLTSCRENCSVLALLVNEVESVFRELATLPVV